MTETSGTVQYLPGALATSHRETSPANSTGLPCWCKINRDHTMQEFFETEEV